MTPPILNLSDVEFTRNLEHGEHFSARMAPVSENIGYDIEPHDIVACPPGGAEEAHQMINTGNGPLR